MYLTFAILCVFYMCAAIGVIINDDDDDDRLVEFLCLRMHDVPALSLHMTTVILKLLLNRVPQTFMLIFTPLHLPSDLVLTQVITQLTLHTAGLVCGDALRRLACDASFNGDFIAHFPQSISVKEF